MTAAHIRSCLLALLIAATAVAQPTQDKTITLHLSDGTVVTGQVLEEADGKIRIATHYLGEVTIDTHAIVDRIAGTPPLQAAATPQPAAASPAPATTAPTDAPVWSRTFGVGGSYSSAPYLQGPIEGTVPGVSGADLQLPGDQLSAQGQLSLSRSTKLWNWFLNAGYTYVKAEPTGRLTDATQFLTNLSRNFNARDYGFTRFSYKSDKVRRVDNDSTITLGVGRRLRNTPTLRLDIMPGIDLRKQESGTIYDGQALAGIGFMEILSATNKRGVVFDQYIIFRTHIEHTELYLIENYLGLKAPINTRVALTIGLTHTYDKMLGLQQVVIPPNAFFPGSPEARFFANNESHLQLTSGLQIRF